MISFILECTIDKLLFTDRHFVVAVRVKWLTLFLAFVFCFLFFFTCLDDLKIRCVCVFFSFGFTLLSGIEPVLMPVYILLFCLKCHCNYCTAIDGSLVWCVFFFVCFCFGGVCVLCLWFIYLILRLHPCIPCSVTGNLGAHCCRWDAYRCISTVCLEIYIYIYEMYI